MDQSMNTENGKFLKIGTLVLTFVAAYFTFYLYLGKYLLMDKAVHTQLITLLENVNMPAGKINLFLALMGVFCLFGFWLVGFVIYKIIFAIVKVSVMDSKLLLSIGTGYAVAFLAGYGLLGWIPTDGISVVTNLLELGIIMAMLSHELKGKMIPVAILRLAFLGVELIFNAVA